MQIAMALETVVLYYSIMCIIYIILELFLLLPFSPVM